MLNKQRMKKINRNEIKDLEKSTRRLYIYRQKDRLQDERGNKTRSQEVSKNVFNNCQSGKY